LATALGRSVIMKCSIMQPTYLPWLGYFDLIDQVDIFVFLDNVQVVKRSWHVRNRIKASQGELNLTIPIKKTKYRDKTLFCETHLNNEQNWRNKHVKSIELAYKKAPFFNEVYLFVKDLIECSESILSKFNINIIKKISSKMGICKELINASQLENISGKKDTLLASICKEIGCDYYLAVKGSAGYLEKNSPGGELVKNGLNLSYQNYDHPVYNQPYGDFIPYMSIIDLLFNHGFENTLEILKSGRKKSIDYLSFRKNHL